MRWIIGLGNPGENYEHTRHNAGFMVINELAKRHNISVTQHTCRSLIGKGIVGGEKMTLVKPMTSMNLSGEAMCMLLNFYNIDLSQIVVVYDDLDTPIGRIRIKHKGSAGGHNGIKSIIQNIGTNEFNRIKVGISRPPVGESITDYVLNNFSKAEKEALKTTLSYTCDVVEYSAVQTFERVMTKYNG